MNTNKLISKAVSVMTITSLTLSAPLFVSAQEVQVSPNPNLQNACGLDIALVMDISGSIDGTELTQEKDAAKAFVNAFLPSTPTTIGLVSFSSGATIVQDLTSDASDLVSDIDGLTTGGTTNWQAAIDAGRDILEGGLDRDDSQNPDLMVFFSDGEPNTGGDYIAAANTAKTSASTMGIRILGVGIGADVSSSTFKSITDGDSSIVSPPDALSINTDVVLSGFDTLATDLANLASALCENVNGGGKIKVINNNGADVVNTVWVKASTGGNDANGGDAGSAGNGGSVNSSDSENTGGTGGNSGNGGAGGAIQSGAAFAGASISNLVNYNVTRVNGCNCGADLIKAKNNNGASVVNTLGVKAKTGWNNTNGGGTGSAGNGGSVNSSNDQNHGGNGGNSGTGNEELPGGGGAGGLVITGPAEALASILNTINSNLITIGSISE